jgi:hypothetical protein
MVVKVDFFVSKEQHGLRVFENQVPKKIFGPDSEEIKNDGIKYARHVECNGK